MNQSIQSTPLSRCADGRRWWTSRHRDNYTSHDYNIAIEPLLREIRTPDGRVVGHVTRNRYEAEVLNTNQMLIVDVDIQDDHGRCPSARLYEVVLAFARRGERLDLEELMRDRLEGQLQLRMDLEDGIEGSWRRYRTKNGFRLLETSAPWVLEPWPAPQPLAAPLEKRFATRGELAVALAVDKDRHEQLSALQDKNEALIAIMDNLYADRDYLRICLDQRLFRARLTPKPWRAKRVDGPTLTCSYLATVGTGIIHPDLESLLREHDAVTGAHALDGTLA